MTQSRPDNFSRKQIVSIYEVKKKKMIIENINKNNYDALVFVDENISRVGQLIRAQKIETVAIYGMGYVGQKLRKVLQNTGIKICYGIDKSSAEFVDGLKVIKPEEVSEDMDIILVTPELYYDDVAASLSKNISVPVVRLSEFLDEIKIMLYKVGE